MTFSIIVPNANQSPGLFPAQNNTNFQRLKDIIDMDHNFTDSAASNQGRHNQVGLINRTTPGALPGINSILYSKEGPAPTNEAELWFYTGLSDVQITPQSMVSPLRIFSINSLLAGTSIVVYPDPGFRYAGNGYSYFENTNLYSFYNILRSGLNTCKRTDFQSPGLSPTLSFVPATNNLQITNTTVSTQVVITSLIINRTS